MNIQYARPGPLQGRKHYILRLCVNGAGRVGCEVSAHLSQLGRGLGRGRNFLFRYYVVIPV